MKALRWWFRLVALLVSGSMVLPRGVYAAAWRQLQEDREHLPYRR